jgi:hypothetical protein
MRRFLWLVTVCAAAAVAVWYGVSAYKKASIPALATLLPRQTIFFAHFPDFNRTRDQWHHSDIYQLYHEAAVQDFLRKPLAKIPRRDATAQTLQEIEQLGPKDAFFALTSLPGNNPIFIAGFRFRGTQNEAEAIIGKWREKLLAKKPDAKREKNIYQQHQIETITTPAFVLAMVYDGHWVFMSNDSTEIKALLDRADRRNKDRQSTLEAEGAYQAAMAHMPSNYMALLYLQPKAIAEKLGALRGTVAQQTSTNHHTLDQIRSVCGATRFDNGKIHDVFFVGMPKLTENAPLTQSSLRLGTKDTFFYLATVLNLEKFAGLNSSGLGGPFTGWLQKLSEAAARNGVTVDAWAAAFELELGSLANWPEDAHWPSLVATLPVKDTARAEKIVGGLAPAIGEGAGWRRTEKDGVSYFFMPTQASLFTITPTIALSNRLLVAGPDSVSVEAAVRRAGADSELSNSQKYKDAARLLPTPTDFFAYIDMPLLYSRLDAAMRPVLLMSAAFMPAISEHVDVSKLPPAEIVAKHLSPIVASQRYDSDGYVEESIGPVTLTQAAIGFGIPAVYWAYTRQQSH